ncbi:SAM-dependent methyltransferase [Gandjariella thermophila]|uniref:S-adenosyl methyltransferase n=1 Tax=Gandjariella thermophila TaxID=1931992 RepID=A0A4D4J912_9PSEU|nr:SAM-dependent methyltransferase [Gandjariella thermophila]GDY33315.1 hypothetical protein GTS_49480 [Gandjariella thermophila]
MNTRERWVPADVDVGRPSPARVYDYLLGGAHNFAVDRALGDQLIAAQPNARRSAQQNRAFLRRAVLFQVNAGIRQFLDIGSGIPTVGNVHEIAQRVAPDARVVYVDRQEGAVAHGRLLLDGNDGAAVVRADLCEPDEVLDAPETRRLLDFDQPIGLLMTWVLHYVPPERDPVGLLARYREALAPGSWLTLSHVAADVMPDRVAAVAEALSRSEDPVFPRTYDEILGLFAGFEVVAPGVVPAPLWRPERPADAAGARERCGIYAGVGRRT